MNSAKVIPIADYIRASLNGENINQKVLEKASRDSNQHIMIESDLRQVHSRNWQNICLEIVNQRKADSYKTHFWATMARRINAGQQFDFGMVEDTRIKQEAVRAGPLFGDGLLSLPYEAVVYNYTLIPDPVDVEALGSDPGARIRFTTLACTVRPDVFVQDALDSPGILAADFIFVPSNDWMRDQPKAARIKRKYMVLMAGATFFQANTDSGKWSGKIVDNPGGASKHHRPGEDLVSLADGVSALSMIVATKGVPLHKRIPTEKQQRARAKKNRALLPVVTQVDTQKYYEAIENVEKGSHASPVPHLRRGHIRRLGDGKQTWVRDTIVNCQSIEEAVEREKYEVET